MWITVSAECLAEGALMQDLMIHVSWTRVWRRIIDPQKLACTVRLLVVLVSAIKSINLPVC